MLHLKFYNTNFAAAERENKTLADRYLEIKM